MAEELTESAGEEIKKAAERGFSDWADVTAGTTDR